MNIESVTQILKFEPKTMNADHDCNDDDDDGDDNSDDNDADLEPGVFVQI